MFDPRAHRDHAADAFRTHDGRQPWPIAIAASDHQQIVLIDGEASSAITTSPAAGAPTSGMSTALTTSAGLPNASIWIACMALLSTDAIIVAIARYVLHLYPATQSDQGRRRTDGLGCN